jgi:hypothetical protein
MMTQVTGGFLSSSQPCQLGAANATVSGRARNGSGSPVVWVRPVPLATTSATAGDAGLGGPCPRCGSSLK